MGTRGVITAIYKGEKKLANYGQWDHYRAGQGVNILAFLRSWDKDRFLSHLERCKFYSPAQCQKLDAMAMPVPYHLSRNRGAEILTLIQEGPLGLVDETDFVKDRLMCETHYILDFDAMTFKIGRDVYDINNLPTDEVFCEQRNV